jgi:LysM domain
MGDVGGGGPRPADRGWWAGRVGATAIGLLLVGWLLVGEVGPPMVLARTLLGLGDPGADPSMSLLALMTLAAEALVGYVLLVLALGSLATLPGLMGRLARRGTFAMTPAVARRLADLLVGGALVVQVTVAAPNPSPGHRSGGSGRVVASSSASGRSSGLAITGDLVPVSLGAGQARWLANTTEPVEARPTPRRSAVSLPPWLGGGPSKPAPRHGAEARSYTVKAGDTLWDIAGAHLPPSQRSAATIHRYWPQVYRANRQVVGADPDLIHPGTNLAVAPFRLDRR